MKTSILIGVIAFCFLACTKNEKPIKSISQQDSLQAVIVKLGITNNQISQDWQKALERRMTKTRIDSIARLSRPLTSEEQDWVNLIQSKTAWWNAMRDSIQVPFEDIQLKDTVYVLLGYTGSDDAFTYENQTVCFDITALLKAYGSAKDSVNDNRIDRIYAHEFTHLLSKAWMKKNGVELQTFKDSILWECIYEGIGMYRSMSSKWFPVNEELSETARTTFDNLYPKFANKIGTLITKSDLSKEEKIALHKNLSRGSMKQKWGALPVGVWLALEAKGNDENLRAWVEKGTDAIIPLARKYLSGESKETFDAYYELTQNSN